LALAPLRLRKHAGLQRHGYQTPTKVVHAITPMLIDLGLPGQSHQASSLPLRSLPLDALETPP
jgi:hypothetical protein